MNYALFGDSCNNGFLAGLSAVLQNTAASYKNWNHGSQDNPRQVNYGNSGAGCFYDFLSGNCTIALDNAGSYKKWTTGSIIPKKNSI